MSSIQEIIEAARALPAGDRAQIIHSLWDTLPPEDWHGPSAAWLTEVAQRSDALDRGEMDSWPWSEVRSRARREAGLDE